MGKIERLDPRVANLIAAGEVVERPASVVKELMENALDAGARQLTVEIQNGGMTYIRVTDDGGGIAGEDIETAFLRHATSKIKKATDLEAIGSLGFRGEALAAIAAVSRVEVLSRTDGEDFGTALLLDGGVVRTRQQAGCPLGTTMIVRDLFYNTPARQKFMKRDAAEGASVFALVQRVALSRPEISVKFLRDGKQELLTPGDGKQGSALYSVFGRDIALGFTEVTGRHEEISVSGFVSLPVCCRGSRSHQHFVLNGRSIKSRLLTAALEEAYRNQKMVGKFPGCALYLKTKLSLVDVNVHPAKLEVKFLTEKTAFDAVYYSVLTALGGETPHPKLHLATPAIPAAPLSGVSQSGWQLRDSATATLTRPVLPQIPRPAEAKAAPEVVLPPAATQTQLPLMDARKRLPQTKPPAADTAPTPAPQTKPPATEASSAPVPPPPPQAQYPAEQPAEADERPWRLAGEVLHTYIMVERGDDIHLIDKHAAHERMHFDRLRAEDYRPMAQSLLEPLVFTPAPEEAAALLAQLPLLEDFGFLLEDFGGGALLLRQIPYDILREDAQSLLCELAADLLAGKRQNPKDARDELLHSVACKAAIKGGQKNTREELLAVAEAVMSGAVKYCPHGRPVAITLSRAQLERQFGRS